MKASRILLLFVMSTSCVPASGMSPAQSVTANPAPQLGSPGPSSPFVARGASASATAPMPAMSKKSKTWLLIGAGAVAAVVLIVLLSGGNGYSPTGY